MSRKGYSMSERKSILEYIVDRAAFNEVKGRKIWVDFARSGTTTRTWQSLKEVFIKRIMPDIQNPYFKLTRDEILQFRRGSSSVANTNTWIKSNVIDDSEDLPLATKPLVNTSNDSKKNGNLDETSSDEVIESSQINFNEKSPISLSSKSSAGQTTDMEESPIKFDEIIPATNGESVAKTSNTQLADTGKNIKSRYFKAEDIFGFSTGQTHVTHRKKRRSFQNPSNSNKYQQYEHIDSDNERNPFGMNYHHHRTSTESVVDSNESGNFVEINSDSDASSSSRQKSKSQPMFAVYNDKLYPIYVHDPNDPESHPRCYMKEKYTMYSTNVVSRNLNKNREANRFRDTSNKFCCINLERLYYNHLLRYVNDGNLGPKPSVRDYLKITNSAKFEHASTCKNIYNRPLLKLHSNNIIENDNFMESTNIAPKRKLQTMRDFPNDEMKAHFYEDLENYYKNGKTGHKPIKESYQRVLSTDEVKRRKHNNYYRGNPREKRVSSIYIDDNDYTINNLHFQTNITKKTDNQFNTAGDYNSLNRSNDYWKSKYLAEKTKNEMICRMISADCNKHTLLKALTMENPEINLNEPNKCSVIVHESPKEVKENDIIEITDINNIPTTSNAVTSTPETSKNKSDSKDKPFEYKISVSKEGEEKINNVFHLNTENANIIIDLFKKVQSKPSSIESENEKTEKKSECVIIPDEKSEEKSPKNDLNKSTIAQKEQEIFDSIFSEIKTVENVTTDRKLFTTQELKMMLGDDSPQNKSSNKTNKSSPSKVSRKSSRKSDSSGSKSDNEKRTTRQSVSPNQIHSVNGVKKDDKSSETHETISIASSGNTDTKLTNSQKNKKNKELSNLVIDCVASTFKADGKRRSVKGSHASEITPENEIAKTIPAPIDITKSSEIESLVATNTSEQTFFANSKFMLPDELIISSDSSEEDHFALNKKLNRSQTNRRVAKDEKSPKRISKHDPTTSKHKTSDKLNILESQDILVKYDMNQESFSDTLADNYDTVVKQEPSVLKSSLQDTLIINNEESRPILSEEKDMRRKSPEYDETTILHQFGNELFNNIFELDYQSNNDPQDNISDHFTAENIGQSLEKKQSSDWYLFSSQESLINSPKNVALNKSKHSLLRRISSNRSSVNSIDGEVNGCETPSSFSATSHSSYELKLFSPIDNDFDIMQTIMSEESCS